MVLKLQKPANAMFTGFDFNKFLAERAGFEPAIAFPLYTLSRRAPSTTRTPLLPL